MKKYIPLFFYIMKTIIFDIDGTLTDMWPIEKSVLLALLGKKFSNVIENIYQSKIKDTYAIFCKISQSRIGRKNYARCYEQAFSELERNGLLPKPIKYPIIRWIVKNKTKYNFVYATGAQAKETIYVLQGLGLKEVFDFNNSLNKNNCRFSKATGLPFKKIKNKFPDCFVVTDSQSDCRGARRAGIPYLKIKPNQAAASIFIDF